MCGEHDLPKDLEIHFLSVLLKPMEYLRFVGSAILAKQGEIRVS